jgi:hypothetical protein
LRTGLTYYGNYQDWSGIPDSVLDRDFARFQNDGIKLILLPVFWNSAEGSTPGSYKTEVFSRLNHIIDKAREYGIKVVMNIHTWYTGTNVPSYAENQRNTIVNSTIRQYWLNFVKYFIRALDKENVESFQVFNELSHHSWSMNVTQDQFYDFCISTFEAARSVTYKPISARWGGDGTNGMEDRFYGIFDYFCTNYYDAYNEPSQLQNIFNKVRLYNRDLWITEYGLATSDDQAQAQRYESNLSLFKSVGIHTAVNWWWSGLRGVGETRYNIADGSGNPRPAYYVVVSYNEGEVFLLVSITSSPIRVTVNVNGRDYATDTSILVTAGSTISITYPEEVES